jgi:hypothetical protein
VNDLNPNDQSGGMAPVFAFGVSNFPLNGVVEGNILDYGSFKASVLSWDLKGI